MKVFYTTNLPTPYRVQFLNELGKLCDLTVAFEGKTAKDRNDQWFREKPHSFKYHFMKGIQTTAHGQFLCLEIIKFLEQKWDKIVICGYAGPTTMIAIEYLRMHKIPFYMELDGGIIQQESRIKYKIKRHFASAAKVWFSSGDETTKWITYYGAKRDACKKYPFTSVLENDLIDAIDLQDKTTTDHRLSFDDCKSISYKDYLARRKVIRDNAKKHLGLSEIPVILSVGQIIPRKGYDILIKAASSLSMKCEIIIVGGSITSDLKSLLDQYCVENIRFMDFMDKSLLSCYYQAADFFVLPTREDIWGLVINEAMSQGLAIITTNKCVAGLELVQNNENGFIIDNENDRQLSSKMSELLTCSDLRDLQGYNNYKKMFRNTIEEMAKVHYDIMMKF